MKKFNMNTTLNIIPIFLSAVAPTPKRTLSYLISEVNQALVWLKLLSLLPLSLQGCTLVGSACMCYLRSRCFIVHRDYWLTSQIQTLDLYLPSINSILIDLAIFLAQRFFNSCLSYWALNPNKIFCRCQANKNGTVTAEWGGSSKMNYQHKIPHFICSL